MSNLQVLFRVRPLIGNETDFAWNVDGNAIELLPSFQERMRCDQKHSFTRIYGESATNEQIFQESIQPLVGRLVDGYNCTVVAYGMSSSGKTSTMLKGPGEQRGLTYLIVREIFRLTEGTAFRVKVQFVEIYNEVMVDLLSADKRQPVLREESQYIYLQNVTEPIITAEEELQKLIAQGTARRTTSDTQLNEVSSRSHAVVRLVLEQGDVLNLPTKKGFKVTKQAAFTLVDLAGSEKIQKTNAQGQRLKESTAINQSLMTLGLVINQLATKQAHISYRDSKLTRLLQNSLGGNAITFMVGCISPSAEHIEESLSTMRFCQRAMSVSNKIRALDANVDQKVKQEQLMVQNRNLKLRIQELEQQLQVSQSQCMNSSNLSCLDNDINLDEISMLLELDPKETAETQTDLTHEQFDLEDVAKKTEQLKQLEEILSGIEAENLRDRQHAAEALHQKEQQRQLLEQQLLQYQQQKQIDIDNLKEDQKQQLSALETQLQDLMTLPEVEPKSIQTSPLNQSQGTASEPISGPRSSDLQVQTSRLDVSRTAQTSMLQQTNKSIAVQQECTAGQAQTSLVTQADKSVAGVLAGSTWQQTSVISRLDRAASTSYVQPSAISCAVGASASVAPLEKSAQVSAKPEMKSEAVDSQLTLSAPLSTPTLGSAGSRPQTLLLDSASNVKQREQRATTPTALGAHSKAHGVICSGGGVFAAAELELTASPPQISPIKKQLQSFLTVGAAQNEADIIQQQLSLRRSESNGVRQSPLKTVHYQLSSDSENSVQTSPHDKRQSVSQDRYHESFSSTVSARDESDTLSVKGHSVLNSQKHPLHASLHSTLESVAIGPDASPMREAKEIDIQTSKMSRSVALGQTRREPGNASVQASQEMSSKALGQTTIKLEDFVQQASLDLEDKSVARTCIAAVEHSLQAAVQQADVSVQLQDVGQDAGTQFERCNVVSATTSFFCTAADAATSFEERPIATTNAEINTESTTVDRGIQASKERPECADCETNTQGVVPAACQTCPEDYDQFLADTGATVQLEGINAQGPLLEGIMAALMEQRGMFSKLEVLKLAEQLETAAMAAADADRNIDEVQQLRNELDKQRAINSALQSQLKQEQMATRLVAESNDAAQRQLQQQLTLMNESASARTRENEELRRLTLELEQQLQVMEDKMDTAQFLSRSMQTSLNEQELQEATIRLFQEAAVVRDDRPDFEQLYLQSELKFNQLKAASRELISNLLKKAKDREEYLNQKATEEITNLKKYKEIVLKLQMTRQRDRSLAEPPLSQ